MTAIWPAGPPKDSRPMRNQVRVASGNDTSELSKRADANPAWGFQCDTGMLPARVRAGSRRAADTHAAYVNAIPQFPNAQWSS